MPEGPSGHPFLTSAPATAKHKPKVPKGQRDVKQSSVPHLHAVTNLDIDVTENCNLGCSYCFKGEMFGRHMDLDTMQSSLEWLLKASGDAESVNCNFMGGEPTMRFDTLKEFVPWARRKGRSVGKFVSFSMTSNLTLFTDEVRQFVDDYGFGLLMSIDGCPEVQDAQRPAKNGKKVSEIVGHWAKSLLSTRPGSQARATVTPEYVGQLEESMKYIHSLGFAESAVSACEYERWTDSHFTTLEKQLGNIVEYVLQCWQAGNRFNLTAFKYYINKLIHPRRGGKDAPPIVPVHQPCGAGKGYMMIDYTGDIWPCHRFDGADEAAGVGGTTRLGNIYGEGFHHELQAAFMDFDHSKQRKPSCDTCPVDPVCGGYCPAANLSDSGSLYTPHDGYCSWSQTMYSFAEKLYVDAGKLGGTIQADIVEDARGTAGTGEK